MCHCDVVLCFSLGFLSNACPPVSSSSCSSPTVPKMAGDGEGIDAHAHGFRGDGTKLLPIWTVFVDGLHLGGANCPWAHASQTYKLLGLWIHGVNAPKLAAGITEEDEEVVGRTLLHLLGVGERTVCVLVSICLYDLQTCKWPSLVPKNAQVAEITPVSKLLMSCILLMR